MITLEFVQETADTYIAQLPNGRVQLTMDPDDTFFAQVHNTASGDRVMTYTTTGSNIRVAQRKVEDWLNRHIRNSREILSLL